MRKFKLFNIIFQLILMHHLGARAQHFLLRHTVLVVLAVLLQPHLLLLFHARLGLGLLPPNSSATLGVDLALQRLAFLLLQEVVLEWEIDKCGIYCKSKGFFVGLARVTSSNV